jgi:hypothetical protein
MNQSSDYELPVYVDSPYTKVDILYQLFGSLGIPNEPTILENFVYP